MSMPPGGDEQPERTVEPTKGAGARGNGEDHPLADSQTTTVPGDLPKLKDVKLEEMDDIAAANRMMDVLERMGYSPKEVEAAFGVCHLHSIAMGNGNLPSMNDVVTQIAACRAEELRKKDSFQSSQGSSTMCTPNALQLQNALNRDDSQDLPSPTEPAFTPVQET